MAQGGQVGAVGGGPGVGGTAPGGAAGAPPAGVGGSTEAQGGATNVAGQGGATSPATQGGAGGAPPAQGGTAGAPPAQGGTGGAPPAGGACVTPPSPSDGVTCTVTCNDDCGVHNLGARVCTCAATNMCDDGMTAPCYDCAGCEFTANANHPLLQPPTAAFPPCDFADDAQEDDETGCVQNERCQSIEPGDGAGRFCGCLDNEWSCDSKPDNFTF